MLDTAMRLGLDLKGGVHMVLGVDLDKSTLDRLGAFGQEKVATDKKVEFEKITVNEKTFELEVKLKNPTDSEKFKAIVAENFDQTLEVLRPVNGVEYLRASPLRHNLFAILF